MVSSFFFWKKSKNKKHKFPKLMLPGIKERSPVKSKVFTAFQLPKGGLLRAIWRAVGHQCHLQKQVAPPVSCGNPQETTKKAS